MLNLQRNLNNSVAGMKAALSDKSFRGQLALGAVTIPLIVFFGTVTISYKLSAIGTYGLLLAIEFLNTAIERLCDRVTNEQDEAIKEVKDIASAAVFVVLMLFLVQCAWILMGNP